MRLNRLNLEPGTAFGHLTILEKVCLQGAGWTTFRAREQDDREVTLRIAMVPEEVPDSATVVDEFLRKAASVVRLEHPHILRVYSFGQLEDQLWLTMQHVASQSSRQDWRPWWSGLDRHQILSILRATAAAIDYLHAIALVHGFLSPLVIRVSNAGVFLDMGLMDWIGDGSFLNQWNSQPPSSRILGNPRYYSVETCIGQVGPPSDVYSLGVIAFEALAGHEPFPAETGIGVILRKAEGKILHPPPERLPPSALSVLRRCLAVDPGERWPSATAFVTALDECWT